MTWGRSAKALLWVGWIAFWLSAGWMPGRAAAPAVLHPDDLLAFNAQQLCGWPHAKQTENREEHCAACWVLPPLAPLPVPLELPTTAVAAVVTASPVTPNNKTLFIQRSRSPPVTPGGLNWRLGLV